jgi:hypothetical protein
MAKVFLVYLECIEKESGINRQMAAYALQKKINLTNYIDEKTAILLQNIQFF